MRPFTSARTKKTTKKFAKFFVQTSNIPERIEPTVARRGGGLGKYGYAAIGAGAPGGVADGDDGREGEAPGAATICFPQWTQKGFLGPFQGPHNWQALQGHS